jgi:hypothetical protein
MPVTFTFYRKSERTPEHGEDIIYLKERSSFDYEGFEPRECEVEYCWFEQDEDGFNGRQVCYEEGVEVPNAKLEILVDGCVMDDNSLWCPVEEYWTALGYDEETDDELEF